MTDREPSPLKFGLRILETEQLVKGQLEMLKAAVFTERRDDIDHARATAMAAYEQHLDAHIASIEMAITRFRNGGTE